ncbi:ARRB1 isoform 4, partial [Pongo abelii]
GGRRRERLAAATARDGRGQAMEGDLQRERLSSPSTWESGTLWTTSTSWTLWMVWSWWILSISKSGEST